MKNKNETKKYLIERLLYGIKAMPIEFSAFDTYPKEVRNHDHLCIRYHVFVNNVRKPAALVFYGTEKKKIIRIGYFYEAFNESGEFYRLVGGIFRIKPLTLETKFRRVNPIFDDIIMKEFRKKVLKKHEDMHKS